MLVCVFYCDDQGDFIDQDSKDCGWVFAQHFCNRLGPAYLHLKNVLDESNPAHAEVLNDIKRRFREETFTRESIAQVIHAHSELVGFHLMNRRSYSHVKPDSSTVCQLCDGSLPCRRRRFPCVSSSLIDYLVESN